MRRNRFASALLAAIDCLHDHARRSSTDPDMVAHYLTNSATLRELLDADYTSGTPGGALDADGRAICKVRVIDLVAGMIDDNTRSLTDG